MIEYTLRLLHPASLVRVYLTQATSLPNPVTPIKPWGISYLNCRRMSKDSAAALYSALADKGYLKGYDGWELDLVELPPLD